MRSDIKKTSCIGGLTNEGGMNKPVKVGRTSTVERGWRGGYRALPWF